MQFNCQKIFRCRFSPVPVTPKPFYLMEIQSQHHLADLRASIQLAYTLHAKPCPGNAIFKPTQSSTNVFLFVGATAPAHFAPWIDCVNGFRPHQAVVAS